MSNTQKKEKMSVVKKMIIALIGGLAVGLIFMFIRSSMLESGNEGAWDIINKILFQDITAADGTAALGLFYIIGQLFMRGLQAAIVPLVLCSLSLAMCSISSSSKLGRIAGRTVLGFVCFYVVGAFFGGLVAYFMKNAGFFNGADLSDAKHSVYYAWSEYRDAFRRYKDENRLKKAAKDTKEICPGIHLGEIINFYLTFLINKVGPVAIFCLVSRTFAIYGAEYLAPAAAYIVGAMITLFILVVTIYPIGIWLTTRLNPFKFLKKIAKVGVFGFSTNSSAATLPLNTRTNLDELGCSQEITSFVLPTGMTINMNGTTVMHMFAVTFIATSAGIDVTPANLVVVAFLSICAAMGCPAIPIAGTTLIVTILSGMGWTSDLCMIAYALVVAINRPVEMALLPLNVIGDAATNVIVNAKEKEIDLDVYNS